MKTLKTAGQGFSLVELMLAMALGLVVLAAMYGVFTLQNKTFSNQEQIVEMQQNVRAAMNIMTRELRMAGYDPTGLAAAGITQAGADSITFTLDVTNDAGTGPPDGDTGDPNECVTYGIYAVEGMQKLGRKSTYNATWQPICENIESLHLTYGSGNKAITVTITGKTPQLDPRYTDPTYGDHYRRYTLTSQVTARNLMY